MSTNEFIIQYAEDLVGMDTGDVQHIFSLVSEGADFYDAKGYVTDKHDERQYNEARNAHNEDNLLPY